MASVITGLPERLTEETATRPELPMHRDGPVEVYYMPFDSVNPSAWVVLTGTCPGRHQILNAVEEARHVLREGAANREGTDR